MRGMESETIPICSVLKPHVDRSNFLTEFWTNKDCAMNPSDYGWRKGTEENTFDIILQDESDEYYYLPKHLLMGCQCRKECSAKCSCQKDKFRKVCSRITCKYCLCFKRPVSDDSEVQEELDSIASEESEESVDVEDLDFDFLINHEIVNEFDDL